MVQTSSTIRMFARLAGTVIAVVLLACGAFGQTSVFFDDFNYRVRLIPTCSTLAGHPGRAVVGLGLELGILLTSRLSLIPLIQAMN